MKRKKREKERREKGKIEKREEKKEKKMEREREREIDDSYSVTSAPHATHSSKPRIIDFSSQRFTSPHEALISLRHVLMPNVCIICRMLQCVYLYVYMYIYLYMPVSRDFADTVGKLLGIFTF